MAEQHYQPRSKGTWGREEAKTAEELNRLCNDFFEKLVVPKEWKFMGWNNAIENPSGVLLSVGKLFRDMRTSGLNLMHYRVFFNSFSCMGGIVSKTVIDFGKYKYHCEVSNKTVDKLNEFVNDRYGEINKVELELNPPDKGDLEITPPGDDGLQKFRDRFK